MASRNSAAPPQPLPARPPLDRLMKHVKVWRRTGSGPWSRAGWCCAPGSAPSCSRRSPRRGRAAQLPDGHRAERRAGRMGCHGPPRLSSGRRTSLAGVVPGRPGRRRSGRPHFVAFDLLRLSGTDTTGWPYRRRRAALESVSAARRLSAPWAPCPWSPADRTRDSDPVKRGEILGCPGGQRDTSPGRSVLGCRMVHEVRMRRASWEGLPGSAVRIIRRCPEPSGLVQVSQSRVRSPTSWWR